MNLKLVDFIRSQRDLGNLLIYYDDEYIMQYMICMLCSLLGYYFLNLVY